MNTLTQPMHIGNLPEILENRRDLYHGTLEYYFAVIFWEAQNNDLPYHNFRHGFHVTYFAHKACIWYAEQRRVDPLSTLSPTEMRILLLSGMFHDFNHTGRIGDDDINVELAIRAIRKYILPQDRRWLPQIEQLIKWTEFPYKIKSDEISLSGKILRDADRSQVMSFAWLQHVVFGLAKEWQKKPAWVLGRQPDYLNSIEFDTEWAKLEFSRESIEQKIQEAKELLAMVNNPAYAITP